MGDKIVFDEDPAAADLGSRYASGFRALPQYLGVHVQKARGFGKGEGAHRGEVTGEPDWVGNS